MAAWIGAAVVLAIGIYVYLVSPRYWDNLDNETPGILRAIWAVVAARNALICVFLIGVAIFAIITGNTAGRTLGAFLLGGVLVAAIRWVMKHPRHP